MFSDIKNGGNDEDVSAVNTGDPNASHSIRRNRTATMGDPDEDLASGGNFIGLEADKFDIILNILIGIRRSCQNLVKLPGVTLSDYQFDKKLMTESDLIRPGNKKGQISSFKFIDYAPMVFQKLRERFQISESEYMDSLGPQQILKGLMTNNYKFLYELCSSGQSGSFFYYTRDKKFLMKTIPRREFIKFRSVLKGYFIHMKQNPESLISRFFGLHEIQFTNSSQK